MLRTVDAGKFKVLAPLMKVLYRVRVQVGIKVSQLTSPATSLLLVGTVNLEFQYGLTLALVFKHINSVSFGLTAGISIHL